MPDQNNCTLLSLGNGGVCVSGVGVGVMVEGRHSHVGQDSSICVIMILFLSK